MLKNYNEIMDKRSNGLCESCEYGFDKCLSEGKAHCIDSEEKEDKSGTKEKSI